MFRKGVKDMDKVKPKVQYLASKYSEIVKSVLAIQDSKQTDIESNGYLPCGRWASQGIHCDHYDGPGEPVIMEWKFTMAYGVEHRMGVQQTGKAECVFEASNYSVDKWSDLLWLYSHTNCFRDLVL